MGTKNFPGYELCALRQFLPSSTIATGSRDRVIGRATTVRDVSPRNRCSIPRIGTRFISSQVPTADLQLTKPPIKGLPGALFTGVKRP